MQTRRLVITGLMILATLTATAAFAQGPGRSAGNGRGPGFATNQDGRGPMMANRLDLSEDQQKAIDTIHEKARAKNLELHKQIMRLRNELKGEMLKDDPDEGTVVDLTSSIGKLRTQMQVNRAKTRLAVRQQLTPEQRDKMLLMGQRHGRRGDRDGRPGRPGRAGCDGPGSRCGSGPGARPGPGFGQGMGAVDDD